jgi:hypothetical protein
MQGRSLVETLCVLGDLSERFAGKFLDSRGGVDELTR